jgi:hypothetical protein
MVSMSTHKQTVTFTEPQAAYLKDEAARLGISVADLVRRIIDHYREDKK